VTRTDQRSGHSGQTKTPPVVRLIERAEDWLSRALPGLGIEEQVTRSIVEHGKNALRVDHLIPEDEAGGPAVFRVTTNHRVLPSAYFGDTHVRSEIHSASLERGRAIFLVRREDDQILAAIAYHLPDRGPLELRAMALRQDPDRPDLWAETRWGVVVCKAYVHVFADKVGRGAALVYEADSDEKSREASTFLGFQRAKRPRGFRLSGRELLTQPKLGR
jgi:hypothetical protein